MSREEPDAPEEQFLPRPPPRGRRWPERVLMLTTDLQLCGEKSLPDAVGEAIEGGVNVVQLREKAMPPGALLTLARQLRGICAGRALLVINDRVDVALLCGADGVHLGEQGLPVATVRQFLPASMVVGRSVHSVGAARQAELDGADYVIAGPVYPSRSHPDAEPVGTGFLGEVTSRLTIPVVAIGGIDADNVRECVAAGASGAAVISSILAAGDLRAAAALLSAAIEERECG